MPPKNHKMGTPTARQFEIFKRYSAEPDYRGKLSRIAEEFGISPANLLKALKAYERNVLLQRGYAVPSLNQLLKRGYTANDNDADNLAGLKKLRLASDDGVTINSLDVSLDDQPSALLEPSGDKNSEERPEPIDPFTRDRKAFERRFIQRPAKGVLRLLFTSAQDGTAIHRGFWDNLVRYEAWCKVHSGGAGAEIIVSGFTYNKSMFGSAHEKTCHVFLDSSELHELDKKELCKLVFFDDLIEGYYSQDRIELDGLLDMCAEINTLPTAVTPLSGFQAYTEERWGIFPHVKHQLESVARMPGRPYKANLTTGACTVPNYIAKKAGQKAEMHHTIGCVIVECLPDGRFWARTISAHPETGNFSDIDRYVDQEGVHEGRTVATISYGDVHHEKVDADVAKATWGYSPVKGKTIPAWRRKSLLDRLRPKYQFFHDVSDFTPRNHHNISDPHFLAATYFRRESSVEVELTRVAKFIRTTKRSFCETVVVQSNHDNAFRKWVKNADVRQDPENAELFHRANTTIYEGLRNDGREPPIFEITLKRLVKDKSLDSVVFVDEHQSFAVNGIEHSQHGHLGPNGSRGSTASLFKVAPKMTTGHSHSPAIRDGLFTSGVCQMEMGYNKGPSSWALAHTIGHHDGSRQILFFEGGDFFAGAA